MIAIDTSQIRRLAKTLERDTRVGLKYAVAGALNDVAFGALRQWRAEMADRLTLRNKWTQGSVRVERARPSGSIERMQSAVGSLADYVEKTEAGGVRAGSGKVGKALPTTVASGEGRGGTKRLRVVRKGLRTSAIKFSSERKGSTPRQRNAAALAIARRKRQRYVFLEGGTTGTGIYRVAFGRKDMRPTMVYNLGRKALRVRPHPTLEPALDVMDRKFPQLALAAFIGQLRRAKAFGY
jgi:hypothetical protein